MEADHRLAEHDLLVRLGRTMGMELDEKPIGASGDLHASLEPGVQTIDRRRLVPLDATVFDSRNHPPLPASPVENQRSLNQHQCVGGHGSCPHGDSPVV